MRAAAHDIYIEQGATLAPITVVYKDSNGSVIDLTGYQGRGHVRMRATDEMAVAEFDVTVVNDSGWQVIITMTPEESAKIPAKGKTWEELAHAAYDIEIYTENDAKVIRLLNGIAYVSPGVTK